MTVVRDQLFPQKPPGSRFRFSRTGVQPSPGSSTIELPSAFAESGAYPPDREPPGSSRQCSLPLACRHPPEGHQIGARKRRTPENTILSQPYCRRVSTDRSDREGSQLAASLEGEPGPTPAGKTLPYSYPETRFRRERARVPINKAENEVSVKDTKFFCFFLYGCISTQLQFPCSADHERDWPPCCVVVVFTLKTVPISTQYFLTSVLVQLTRTPSVVTG